MIEFVLVFICTMHLTRGSLHANYAFHSKSTLYIFLNIKKFFAWSRCHIWNLIDCNGTRTNNYVVCKGTINSLTKLAKWLSCVLSTYLHRSFNCMFFSCYVHISEWFHTQYLPESQGIWSLKQVPYLKFEWL